MGEWEHVVVTGPVPCRHVHMQVSKPIAKYLLLQALACHRLLKVSPLEVT